MQAMFLRVQRIEELKQYMETQETALTKFDEDLFRKLIEKVSVRSLVEGTFALLSQSYKVGTKT